MLNYMYLLIQLPFIELNSEPKINSKYFEEQCRTWLTESELAVLFQESNSETNTDSDINSKLWIAKQWKEKDEMLRSIIAVCRLQRANQEEGIENYRRDITSSYAFNTISDLVKMNDPLTIEYGIAKIRWEILDELALMDSEYSFTTVYTYYEKLKIASRFSKLNQQLGEKTVKDIINISKEKSSKILEIKENEK